MAALWADLTVEEWKNKDGFPNFPEEVITCPLDDPKRAYYSLERVASDMEVDCTVYMEQTKAFKKFMESPPVNKKRKPGSTNVPMKASAQSSIKVR